jgi:hypothetical protein
MAFSMKLTNGTSTLADLSGGTNCAILHGRGGWRPGVSEDDEVRDTIDLRLTGGMATIQTTINTIEQHLAQARRYEDTRMGYAVYLEVRPHDAGDWYRSLVLDGWVSSVNLDIAVTTGVTTCQFNLVRENYFEASTEVQAPLTNPNGTNNTTGLKIYSCNDGTGTTGNKRNNYVTIASGSVIGSLPSPARVELTNTYATGNLSAVWIGQSIDNATTLTEVLEAESASGVSSTVSSDSSGGYFVNKSMSQGVETDLLSWTLPDTLLDPAGGQWFHALLRTDNSNDRFYFRLKIIKDGLLAWQSDQVRPKNEYAHAIRDLFALRLPPSLPGQTGYGSVTLTLTGQQYEQASLDLWLDFLALVPSHGWRFISTDNQLAVDQGHRIIDDGILRETYRDTGSGAGKTGLPQPSGDFIHLWPARDQRLFFWLHSDTTNTAEVDRTATIKIYYRPRRRTL